MLLLASTAGATPPQPVGTATAAPVVAAMTAGATPHEVVVEIGNQARELVDARVTRRLVELELSEVELSPPHDAQELDTPTSVYVRVTVATEGTLVVELWSRGQMEGRRHVSTKGGARLRARRIALVSAELARALQRKRRAAAKRARERALEEARNTPPPHDFLLYGSSQLRAAALGASVAGDDLWLVGPALSVGVELENGAGVSARFEWLTGGMRALDGAAAASAQWYAASFRPHYAWALDARYASRATWTLEAGGALAFAGVRLLDVASTSSPTQDAWTARATGDLTLRARLSPLVHVALAAEAGALLRPLTVTTDTGEDTLNGAWLGGSLQLMIGR